MEAADLPLQLLPLAELAVDEVLLLGAAEGLERLGRPGEGFGGVSEEAQQQE